jgi:hypothetical protein
MAALLGFFTQQLVQFQHCLQRDSAAVVRIFKTNNYDATGAVSETGTTRPDIYPPMFAAINNAIVQPTQDYTNVLSNGCVTGNCTFPVDNGASFSTLGVSHSCEDVTSQIVKVYLNDSGPGQLPFIAYLNATDWRPGSEVANASIKVGYRAEALSTVAMDNGNRSLTTVKMLYRPKWQSTDKIGSLYNVSGLSCSIYPVVKTYGVNISHGIMQEKLLQVTRIGESPLSDKEVRYKLATNRTLHNGTWKACQRQKTNSTGFRSVPTPNIEAAPWAAANPSASVTGLPPGWVLNDQSEADSELWYYPEDCVWSISVPAVRSIETCFKEIFDKQVLLWPSGVGFIRLDENVGSIYLRQIFRDGNMTLVTADDIFRNIADAMSAVIRGHGTESATGQVRGEMWYQTTCIQIQWEWISFPSALVALSMVFLVLVVIESRGVEGNRLWKSSVLAMLFCDVEQVDAHEMEPIGNKEMGYIARSTSVSVDVDNLKLRLVSR